MADLLVHGADPDYAPLGCAIPSAELLSAAQLDRYLARIARKDGTALNTYTGPQGILGLREEICRRALRWGQVLVPEHVTITNGCTEALGLALRAVSKRGDTVAIETPTYFGLLQIFESLELKVLEVPTDPQRGLQADVLEQVLESQHADACLLASSFNNPLGCTSSEDNKRAIIALLARHNIPLIEDDIYGDIYFGSERPRPYMALADESGGHSLLQFVLKDIGAGISGRMDRRAPSSYQDHRRKICAQSVRCITAPGCPCWLPCQWRI